MTMQSIEWHKECWKNRHTTYERRCEELERIQADVARMQSELAAYAAQIERAEQEGRDEFDRDRYNRPAKRMTSEPT